MGEIVLCLLNLLFVLWTSHFDQRSDLIAPSSMKKQNTKLGKNENIMDKRNDIV